MTKTPFNPDREFIRWFYEQPYPSDLSNRAMVMQRTPTPNTEQRDYWMRQAFHAGMRAMAGETLCILGDWTAACSGLDPDLVCPDEVFERAAENLEYYYKDLEVLA